MVRSNGAVCKGCDIPAVGRENNGTPIVGADKLGWADTPWMIGYWIGTLAMEYQLLIQSGLSSTSPQVMQTKEDLYGAIQSINRLDWEAEESWGCSYCGNSYTPCPGNINGFLIRDDVPTDFSQVQSIIDGLNDGLVPPRDDYRDKCISSAFTEYLTPGAEASWDHLTGLFIGLALVKKCLAVGPPTENWNNTPFINGLSEASTSSFIKEVQIISQRIITYLNSPPDGASPWTYENPCAHRCVVGVSNPTNLAACGHPDPAANCSFDLNVVATSNGQIPYCCESGGALAQPEAIGFAAANQFIQGHPDFILTNLATNPVYWLAWNGAINKGDRKVMTLVALGNIWKVGICLTNVTIHLCTGIPFVCTCCIDLGYITITIPLPCSSTTAQVSDHLVNAGKNNYWEHLYLLHKLLFNGGTTNISNSFYECLLDAAPCRGYDGAGSNTEWSHNDRLAGDRAGNYSEAFSRVDYLFYYNLYNLHNFQGSYTPIPIKQLAPDNIVKPDANISPSNYPYEEYDKKNFIAAQTITAHDYKITFLPSEGQGRVTFAAGQKITLSNGFKVINGGYFHGYIDPTISAMHCSDPPSQTECSGLSPFVIDTVTDADSVIVSINPRDSVTNILPCPIDTLHLHGKNIKNTATSFYWNFGNGQTSQLENPDIYYSSPGNYILTLIAISSSKTDTFSTQIIVPDCQSNGRHFSQSTAAVADSLSKELLIIPNPSSGKFTISISDGQLGSLEITDLLGNIVYRSDVQNKQYEIDLSSKPKGIYFVKVTVEDKIFTDKIIIQ